MDKPTALNVTIYKFQITKTNLPILMRFLLCFVSLCAHAATFNLADFKPTADGKTDDTAALGQCFEAAGNAGGGVITIPAGNYAVKGDIAIPLCSNLTVSAYGARFLLPESLGDKARITLFHGTNVQHLSWFGGEFVGHCFDHKRPPNSWEPNVATKMIVIDTSADRVTSDLTFRDIKSERVAGAVVSVFGALRKGSEREVERHALNVTLDNLTLIDSGRFMWDYGLLWQIMIWPEEYRPEDVAMAKRYFRNDLVHEDVIFEEDLVKLDNTKRPMLVSKTHEAADLHCFFGDNLPGNVKKGRAYYIVESAPDHLKVSETLGGSPVQFETRELGVKSKMMQNLTGCFFGLYAPTGGGTGKGCFDLTGCKGVRVTGCKLSALGDTMHIQRSEDIVFANNHILGSRMGAFFLAEFCKNATITGNIVDGGNGSRVISVEKSCEDVTMIGNTFRNGGRGAWINQPRNFILQGNVFINNTTKGEPDPWRGRRSPMTGEYLKFPELYFTQYEPEGSYGNIIVKDNLFVTGPGASAVMTFARGGSDITVESNHVQGEARDIIVEAGSERVHITNNDGADKKSWKAKEVGSSLMYHGRPE